MESSRVLHLSLALVVSTCIVFGTHVKSAEAAVSCSANAPAQNNLMVAPSHGSVFYIDTGVSPKLDAGYIGYRIGNRSGSTQSSLWAQVSGFGGGVVQLNNVDDANMQVASVANNATTTVYYMLKASGATQTAQTHTLKIYDKRPDLSGATVLYQCDFTFSQVKETIKAAANKLSNNGLNTSAAIEVSNTSPKLGELLTITVEGQTGQIGQGGTPDFDIIWLDPAAVSSWPTRALRLESMSIAFDGNNNWSNTGDEVTYDDQLLIQSVDGLTNVDNSGYRITYRFRVIGSPQSTVKVVPVAMISSGTQIKHSDISATGGTLDISFSSLVVIAALTKSVTATSGLTVVTCSSSCVVPSGINGTTYVAVPYRLRATTTSATNLTIDEMVDTPGAGTIFKTGSASITDVGRSSVAIPDPVYIASESGLSPRPNHFVGPFTFVSGTDATLDYMMWIPVGTYDNVAYAQIGDLQIGATASAKQKVTVTSTGTSNVTATVGTESFGVDAVTNTATGITSSAATLNGTVDPNGTNPLTATFSYGTDPNLAGASTITATTPVSGTLSGLNDPTSVSVDLSGLSSGTTYYFKVIAGAASGDILSFTTDAVLAAPTVTTTAATGISVSGATLNGTINPNLSSITAIQFVYATNASLNTNAATTTLDDGAGTALTAGGSSVQAFSTTTTNLVAGTTYFYKIRACTASSGTFPNITCSAFVDGSVLSFTAAVAPTVTTNAPSLITSSSMTLNGAISATGGLNATQSGFAYGTDSTLASVIATSTLGSQIGTASFSSGISGLTAATTYYIRAYATNSVGTSYGVIVSTTTLATVTPPSVSTNAPSLVSTSTMTLNGVITATGGANATQSGFAYGTDSTLGTVIATSSLGSQVGTASFSSSISGLSPNTTYYIRAYATNSSGTSFGSIVSTTTAAITVPSVTTNAPTAVTNSSMVLNGAITSTGGSDATQSGFAYGTDSALISVVATSTLGAQTGTASFSTGVSSLSPSTTYYIRAYATNSSGTSYGSVVSTTTLASVVAPSVTTSAPSSVTTSSMTLSGAITATGGANATQSGFAYSTNSTLSSEVATTTLGAQSGTATFSGGISGLSSATTYYIRAYATNSAGTSFGNIISTTTLTSIVAPTVTTSAATAISSSGMTLNGVIASTGGSDATQSGFAYGVDSALVTTLATTTLGSQTGTASFATILSSLNSSTAYYFRAYAVNSAGTSFGAILSATTLAPGVTSTPETPLPRGGGGPPVGIVPGPLAPVIPGGNASPPPSASPLSGTPFSTQSNAKEPNVSDEFSAYVCQRYLKSYISLDAANDPQDVRKVQEFLNTTQKESLVVDGVYKQSDYLAVKRFQQKYADQILAPWGRNIPTGRVYKTTTAKINLMMCAQQKGCPYFKKYLKSGDSDFEVVKVQDFLNLIFSPISGYPTKGLVLTREYTVATKSAVENFQEVYRGIVLLPWGMKNASGWWYQSSRHAANKLLECEEGQVTLDNGIVIR